MESDRSETLDFTEGQELGGENLPLAWSGEMADAEGSAFREASREPEAVSAKTNEGQGAASGSPKNGILDVLESPTATCSGAATDAKGSVLGALLDSSEQPPSPRVEAMAATGSSNNGESSTDAKDAMPSPTSRRPPSRSRKQPRPTRFIADQASSAASASTMPDVLDIYLSSRIHSSSETMPDWVTCITGTQLIDEGGIEGFGIRDVSHYLAHVRELKAAGDPQVSASATGPPKDPMESSKNETLDLTEGQELGGKNSTAAFSGEMANIESPKCQEGSPEPEAIAATANDDHGAASGSPKNAVLDVLENVTATCSGEETNAQGSVLGALIDSSELQPSMEVEAMAATGSSNNGKNCPDPKDAMPSSSPSRRPPTRSQKQPRPTRSIGDQKSSAMSTIVNADALDTYNSSRIRSSPVLTPNRVRNITAELLVERGIKGFEMRGAHYYLARVPANKGAIIPSSSASSGSALPSAPATGPPKEPDESGSGPLSLRTILGSLLACAAVSCVLFFFFGQSKVSSDLSSKQQKK